MRNGSIKLALLFLAGAIFVAGLAGSALMPPGGLRPTSVAAQGPHPAGSYRIVLFCFDHATNSPGATFTLDNTPVDVEVYGLGCGTNAYVSIDVYVDGAWNDLRFRYGCPGWDPENVLVVPPVVTLNQSYTLDCPSSGIEHGPVGGDPPGASEVKIMEVGDGAVGGIAELPDASDPSAPNYVALAGLAAAALVALTAGAWHARRRWSR
jgi:hypothetical protein